MNLTSRKVVSFSLFSVLVFSIFFSLPFLNFQGDLPSVYADSTSSGFNFFTDMIDISDDTINAWTDIDVSAHVPSGTTGVIVRYDTDTQVVSWDVRENGSTDDDYSNSLIWTDNQKIAYVGVDDNYIFEQKISNADCDSYLMGYTDSFVTFFDNAKDYSIGSAGSWTTVDVSSDVPEGATGVILKVKTIGTVYEGGVRHPDSTDDFHKDIKEYTWMLCGVNEDREFEAYVENLNVDHYLLGYTVSPITFLVNWDDVSLGVTGAWTDIDVTAETSENANGIIIYMIADPSWKDICIRENGSSDNPITSLLYIGSFEFGACGLDNDNIFEGYISATTCDFYVVAYTEQLVAPAPPENEDVFATPSFSFNKTIGWINVSVSHIGGYDNISSIMIQVETYGDAETCNLTWVASTDSFTETEDLDDIIELYTSSSESVISGSNQYNVSFHVFFKRGAPGEPDIHVLSTDIESRTDSDTFTDETFLSEFQRASGFTWDYEVGTVDGGSWGYIDMSDDGEVTALSVYTMNTVYIFNSTGSIIRTLLTHDANFSQAGVYLALSGDGNYLVTAVRPQITPSHSNITLWDLSDGSIVWTYYDSGVTITAVDITRDGSYIVSNYQSGSDFGLVYYNQDGRQWTATTMLGVPLPIIVSVSIGADSNVIACGGSDDAGTNWDYDTVFLFSTFSSEPIWVWNMSVGSVGSMYGVEVSDDGYYLASADGHSIYSSSIQIWYYASATPLLSVVVPYGRCTSNKEFDFVAEQDLTDVFYVSTGGQDGVSSGSFNSLAYNVTADTYTSWSYDTSGSLSGCDMSKSMKNNRYYIGITGGDGTEYFDTTSNTSLWTYYNSSHYIGYDTAMNEVGEALASSHFDNQGVNEIPWIAYFGVVESYPFELGNFNVTNMEGCGNWVFADERFYHFEANFTHLIDVSLIDTVGLRFSDGLNTIYVYYDNTNTDITSEGMDLVINPQFDPEREPVRIQRDSSSVVDSGTSLIVTWDLWFTNFVFDELNVDVYYYMNDTMGDEIEWELGEADVFHIYNQGGLVETETSNDAGRTIGGDSLELYAYEESYVQANVTYRNLQHIHFYVRLEGNKEQWDQYESDPWNFSYGMYVCPYGEEWIEGWKLVVELDSVTGSWIRLQAIGDRAFYLTWNATWWYRNSETADWELILADTFSSFPVWNNTERCYTAFWVDFWFNTANFSSVVGGRINAEYFGIYDKADLIVFGFGSDWSAYLGNVTQSMFFHNLENTDGEVITARQLKMMKFFARIDQGDNPSRNNTVILRDYDLLDFRTAQGQMDGVATPIVVATKMPETPSSGFLAGLVSALRSVFEFLLTGALSVWRVFVSFLDVLFSFLGWENGFSTILYWIESFLSLVIQGIGYVVDMIGSLFSLMAVWLVFGITQFTSIADGLVVIYDTIVDVYVMAEAGWLPVAQFITPLLPLLPLVFFLWIVASDDVNQMIQKITMVWGMVHTLIGFLVQIGQYLWSLISGLIESIQW